MDAEEENEERAVEVGEEEEDRGGSQTAIDFLSPAANLD